MAAQQPGGFDLETKLRQRLNMTKAQKDATHTKINTLNEELQRLFTRIPKKPRESLAQVDQKISALEFARTTTSLILSDEKDILREIAGLQRLKNQIEEYNACEGRVQEIKGNLNNHRDALKKTSLAIDELEKAIAKVRMAKKLGCAPAELMVVSVDCPAKKIGLIIGRNGANIKMIEEKSHVSMDVDSVKSKIHLTGSHAAIQDAIVEIDRVVKSIDEEVHVSDDLITYMTSKRISLMKEIRRVHRDVQIEAIRERKIVVLRGLPQDVSRARQDVMNLVLSKETRTVSGKEAAALVGKGGVTINSLVEKYESHIDVSECGTDVFAVTITGPADRVHKAALEVDNVVAANKEIVLEVPVEQSIRNTMLKDSGAAIKKLQREVNSSIQEHGTVLLSFNKPRGNEDAQLMIKGSETATQEARKMVLVAIATIRATLVKIDVDPFVIPKIIGRGGETIRRIRDKTSATVEVNKAAGKVEIHALDPEDAQEVANFIHKLIDQNQVVRIDYSPSLVRKMFLDVRNHRKAELENLVFMGLDDDAYQIVLRGSPQNLKKAEAIVRDYMRTHFIQQVEISGEDEPTLLIGGSDSPITRMSEQYGVDLSVNRSKMSVAVIGQKEKVEVAVKALHQFLRGGDGFTVSRLSVSEQALGVVIGKNGSKRQELEKVHKGVNLFIHKSNRIAIRGPKDSVEACRRDILRLVSTVRVHQTVPLAPKQHATLSRTDAIRKVTSIIPVIVTISDRQVKLRGLFADVRDAEAMIREIVTGSYEARINLESSQMASVCGATRDPKHLERMKEESGGNIKVDQAAGAICISGNRQQVTKGKQLVADFLQFLLPNDFVRLPLLKPLHSTIGEAGALGEIAAVSGATVYLDRDLECIHIQTPDPDRMEKAQQMVKRRMGDSGETIHMITLEDDESWILPLIIGKGGNRINALRLETCCDIDINMEDRSFLLSSDDPAVLAAAKESLMNQITDLRRRCAIVQVPSAAMASFVGKSGSHIRAFSQEHGVEIERPRRDRTKLRITGDEDAVHSAKKAAEDWIAQWMEKEEALVMNVTPQAIPVIVGKGGSTISAIQKEFECRIEINREEGFLTIRAAKRDIRQAVLVKLTEISEQAANSRRNDPRRNDRETNGHAQHSGNGANGNGHYNDSPNNRWTNNYTSNNNTNTIDGTTTTSTPTYATNTATNNNNGQELQQQQQQGSETYVDGRRDRRSEFSARPVGLTVVETSPKKKRNRNRNNNGNNSHAATTTSATITNPNNDSPNYNNPNQSYPTHYNSPNLNNSHENVTHGSGSGSGSFSHDISDDSTLQVGTAAGRNLFNLLVSESSPSNTNTNIANHQYQRYHNSRSNSHVADDDRQTEIISNSTKVVVTGEEPWDSSTVSSGLIGSDPGDDMIGTTTLVGPDNKAYVKSASGFQVRL